MEETSMRFSANKFWKGDPITPKYGYHWSQIIDGKEVKFEKGSNFTIIEGYVVLRDWCEPINNSDN